MRELIERVTIKDCVVETFKTGGNGGQGRDKRDTGVRITHPPSGATAISSDQRSQLQNKRLAFRRMAESPAFQAWARRHDRSFTSEPSKERIRTYNLVERRVTDHRTGAKSALVEAILDGDLDLLQ